VVRRPKLDFGDDHIQPGESYHVTSVSRVDIEESGDMTHVELTQSSGIKRLDSLLLTNIQQGKYAPRPGCGVIQSNTGITIDWR
jgi:outer membrane biosynthesis protein TonB